MSDRGPVIDIDISARGLVIGMPDKEPIIDIWNRNRHMDVR